MKLNWGKSIVLFFIVFITLCICFIIFSLQQNNDLVSGDYYQQGADYTKQMQLKQRSQIYADSIKVFGGTDGCKIVLKPSITSVANNLKVSFYRSDDKKRDFARTIGQPVDTLLFPPSDFVKGHYSVSISWVVQNNQFGIEKDLTIK